LAVRSFLAFSRRSGFRRRVSLVAILPHDTLTPILAGEYAVQKFGAPQQKSPFKQDWRLSVTKGSASNIPNGAPSSTAGPTQYA
jgi:hypothetical protein